MNIMEMAQGAIGRQVVEQLGKVLGEDHGKVQKAVGGAVPAILAAVLKKAATPAGAQDIFKQVQDNDGGILDNIGDILGGGGHQQVLKQGSGILQSLLGGNLGDLVSLIGKISGISSGSSTSLLGVLAPMIFGMLGKQQSASGWDLAGFTNMLSGQKENIAKSLPAGAIDALGLGDLGLEQFIPKASQAASTANFSASPPKESGSMIGKILPILLLAAIAFFGYKFLSGGKEKDKAAAPAGSGLSLDLGDLKLDPSTQATKLFDEMTTTFKGITDEATAKVAVPQLTTFNDTLGGLLGGMDKLPAASKTGLLSTVSGYIPQIKEMIETVMAIPGVKAILEPIVGKLVENLDKFQ